MSTYTDKLDALLIKIEALKPYDCILKAHVALGRDYLKHIYDDLEGMEFNEKHLRKDCERLRLELDDINGVIR